MTKFVLRLVDADKRVLSWTAVAGKPRPQPGRASCPIWPSEPTWFDIRENGTATAMQIHWCDLDVAREAVISPVTVEVGQRYAWTWVEPMWLVSGMSGIQLQPVTEYGRVAIGVPTGNLGVATY